MTDIDHDQLAELMARMPDDPAALFAFVDVHGGRLAAIVRSHLRSFGRHDLARDADEVQGTVWEVAFFLRERAAAWQPGSALPWTWARRGIRTVSRTAGHATADVDLEYQCRTRARCVGRPRGRPRHPADTRALALLRGARRHHPARPRRHIEYRIQWSLGDLARTPSAGLRARPRNVRQIDRRVRRSVQLLGRRCLLRTAADLPCHWVLRRGGMTSRGAFVRPRAIGQTLRTESPRPPPPGARYPTYARPRCPRRPGTQLCGNTGRRCTELPGVPRYPRNRQVGRRVGPRARGPRGGPRRRRRGVRHRANADEAPGANLPGHHVADPDLARRHGRFRSGRSRRWPAGACEVEAGRGRTRRRHGRELRRSPRPRRRSVRCRQLDDRRTIARPGFGRGPRSPVEPPCPPRRRR
jgi:hypothetical protein